MDAVRKAFGYPFTELVHPAGRKRLVPKGALNGGSGWDWTGGDFISSGRIRRLGDWKRIITVC